MIAEKQEQRLKSEVKDLRAELSSLKQENEKHKQELFVLKSVKNQLNIGKIFAENEQLKKFKETVMSFLDSINLRERFNQFIAKHKEMER